MKTTKSLLQKFLLILILIPVVSSTLFAQTRENWECPFYPSGEPYLSDKAEKFLFKTNGWSHADFEVDFFSYFRTVQDARAKLGRQSIAELESLALSNDGRITKAEMQRLLQDYENFREYRICHSSGHTCRVEVIIIATPESDQALSELKVKYGFRDLAPRSINIEQLTNHMRNQMEETIRVAAEKAFQQGNYSPVGSPQRGTCVNHLVFWYEYDKPGPYEHKFDAWYSSDGMMYFSKKDVLPPIGSDQWFKFPFTVDQVLD